MLCPPSPGRRELLPIPAPALPSEAANPNPSLSNTSQTASTLIVAVFGVARRTPTRQRAPRLLHNPTRQTQRPLRIPSLRRHLLSIRDHRVRLRHWVLQLRCRDTTVERILLVGEVDDGQHGGVVAAEESRAEVEGLGDEGVGVRDDGHSADALELGLLVGVVDLGAVGVVGGGVGGIVVDEEDVDETGRKIRLLVGYAVRTKGLTVYARTARSGCSGQSLRHQQDTMTPALRRKSTVGIGRMGSGRWRNCLARPLCGRWPQWWPSLLLTR